ncbi:MAG: hypothetical protein KBG39_03140 [Opitutaceae bacterium]|nr:hypothetical protein [Opitutaceae bacterium]MBP8961916.1 hypothetical protein [Opitutaceae bacterium]
MNSHSFHPRTQRGSVLIVALLFSIIIAISLGSYLSLSQSTLRMANRAFYYNGALNLAETGLEQAMWSINKAVAQNASAWADWTTEGSTVRRKIDGLDYGHGVTGQARVRVYDYTGSNTPYIVVRATLASPTMPPVEKWLRVGLIRGSRFANGLVAKESITFSGGNVMVDSWNSDPDRNPATAAIPFSNAVRNDKGSVGSVSIQASAIDISNSAIWGSAATGGSAPRVGPNGSILNEDSALADKTGWSNPNVDPSLVSTDFTANFDPVAQPTATPIASVLGTGTIGAAGTSTTLCYTALSLSGNSSKVLTVEGHVTLILNAPAGTDAISMSGQASIHITEGSSLTIYTAGDVAITGGGLVNDNPAPITFQLWGTSTSTTTKQDIKIAGNGVLKAVVYAPNGTVTATGGGSAGEVMGSIVANDVSLTGGSSFHYDESLADLDVKAPFRIGYWSEMLNVTDRAAYAADFEF